MEKKEKNNRREFLTMASIAGAGVLAGGGINAAISNAKHRKVKLLTASGELVEVEVQHLPGKAPEKKISNAELKDWMENKE